MKSTIKLFTLAFVALFAVSCNNNDEYDMLNSLWRNVTQNEARIDDLEKWCSQANTNITSLQTIVNVIESNDVVTSVTPIMEGGVEVGYTITFANHDPITIYHGKDGKDGVNGADGVNGQDGVSPIVGVAKDTDGVYYWTLNGEWLLDADGNKLRVSGQDGAAGADGNDGQNGQDGADGQDGVTPQLKIEADYWWISYDNGNTWAQLGKAKGEDGENGQNGAKGDKGDTGDKGDKGDKGDAGDSMFQSVTQDADNVYFTLADGTVITIAKGGGGADQPNSDFLFTITYMPNGGEGEIIKDTVCYGDTYTPRADSAYFYKRGYCFLAWNTKPDGTGIEYTVLNKIQSVTRNITFYAKWIKVESDLAIDLGLPSGLKWAACNIGANFPEEYGNYYGWGEVEPEPNTTDSYKTSSPIPLEFDAAYVNMGSNWRMPTQNDFLELSAKTTCIKTTNYANTGVAGSILIGPNGRSIFFPAAGMYNGDEGKYVGEYGYYWSSSNDNMCIYAFFSLKDMTYYNRSSGYKQFFSVRGVCP